MMRAIVLLALVVGLSGCAVEPVESQSFSSSEGADGTVTVTVTHTETASTTITVTQDPATPNYMALVRDIQRNLVYFNESIAKGDKHLANARYDRAKLAYADAQQAAGGWNTGGNPIFDVDLADAARTAFDSMVLYTRSLGACADVTASNGTLESEQCDALPRNQATWQADCEYLYGEMRRVEASSAAGGN